MNKLGTQRSLNSAAEWRSVRSCIATSVLRLGPWSSACGRNVSWNRPLMNVESACSLPHVFRVCHQGRTILFTDGHRKALPRWRKGYAPSPRKAIEQACFCHLDSTVGMSLYIHTYTHTYILIVNSWIIFGSLSNMSLIT